MKVIKPTKIKPLFDNVLTTLDLYEEDYYENGIITQGKGEPKMIQKIVSVGTNTPFKEGQIVHINPVRYAKMKHTEGSLKDNVIEDNAVIDYILPIIILDNKPMLLLVSRDIDYIIEDYNEVEAEKPKSTLILPSEKKIIV